MMPCVNLPLTSARHARGSLAGMDWLAELYANTMNIIHYMHDRYDYERLEMALHDTFIRRFIAFGVRSGLDPPALCPLPRASSLTFASRACVCACVCSGLSVVTDSLSAIKYAKVTPIRNDKGIAVDFKVRGLVCWWVCRRGFLLAMQPGGSHFDYHRPILIDICFSQSKVTLLRFSGIVD
jgi:hypothetical protein